MNVTMVSFPTYSRILPLASGYLQAYAQDVPEVRAAYSFVERSYGIDEVSEDRVVDDLVSDEADLYTFSCYVWNSSLVRRVIGRLRKARPNADFLLGGPQVMNQAEKYIPPSAENIYVCNGEGERTFRQFLQEKLEGRPDMTRVRGLSMLRDGEYIRTEDNERIRDLEEIPSPFLNNIFPPSKYSWILFETNRGCPFKCSYCYWGAATGSKVVKYASDRVLAELDWITKYPAFTLYICDANVGMLPRDLEYAEFLAEKKRATGFPHEVFFSSSKNTPTRVASFVEIMAASGMITMQPVSLQTMSERALANVSRENIRPESYLEIQKQLNAKKLSSYIELLWPLPGETLESFKSGIDHLCATQADTFQVYPLLLMNNVPMNEQREKFNLQTARDPDPNGEAEIVVSTEDVTSDDYLEGLKFTFAETALYSTRGLRAVGTYLHNTGVMSFAQLMSEFSRYSERRQNFYAEFIRSAVMTTVYKFTTKGAFVDLILRKERGAFEAMILDFLKDCGVWRLDEVRRRYELDFLNRPFAYWQNFAKPSYEFKFLEIEDVKGHIYKVRFAEPVDLHEIFGEGANLHTSGAVSKVSVDHDRGQMPFMLSAGPDKNSAYCHGKLYQIRSILPLWKSR